ncbi:MAG: hypothetical protein SXA11_09270 [Cyanobacteriota bacterium]|nr:hypothetical protein [Cyanobacteriota bacterium]
MSEEQPQQPNSEPAPKTQKTPSPKPSLWGGVLGSIRSLLPTALSQKLSDGMLAGAMAAIFLLLLTLPMVLPNGQPAEIAAIEQVPPEESTLSLEEISPDISLSEGIVEDESSILVAPEPPEAVEVKSAPAPKLTPEQYLVVTIQNEVADITNQYGGGVIESIKVNFPASMLVVQLSNDWYDLDDAEQDELARKMFQQARDLDFKKLEAIDPEGVLLARDPIVGSSMIILQRSLWEM